MITLENLSKKYKNTLAVNNLSLNINNGHVTGFLGPNGAGKSTTMRMIMNLIFPTNGKILIDGKPYKSFLNPLKNVGASLDINYINQNFTAKDYLLYLGETNGIGVHRINETLELAGLSKVSKTKIKNFSLGMKQRLSIAAAILGDPDNLIFDEPFNGLDIDGINWLRKLVKHLASMGKTVFVSSHLLTEMEGIADRIVIIAKGELVTDMNKQEMIDRSMESFVLVKCENTNKLKDTIIKENGIVNIFDNNSIQIRNLSMKLIGEICYREKIPLWELSMHRPALEDIFRELTEGKGDYNAKLS